MGRGYGMWVRVGVRYLTWVRVGGRTPLWVGDMVCGLGFQLGLGLGVPARARRKEGLHFT